MNKEEIQVGLNITAQISDAEKALAQLKKEMPQFNLGKDMKASLNQAMADLTAEIDKVKSKTEGGKSIKLVDEKEVRASMGRIASLVNTIVTKTGSKGFMSSGLTKDVKAIANLQKAVDSVLATQDKTGKSAGTYAKEIAKTEKELAKEKTNLSDANRAYEARKKLLEDQVKEAQKLADETKKAASNRGDNGRFKAVTASPEDVERTQQALEQAQGALEKFNQTGINGNRNFTTAITNATSAVDNHEKKISELSAEYEKLVAQGMQEVISKAQELGIPTDKVSSFEELKQLLEQTAANSGPELQKALQALLGDVDKLSQGARGMKAGFDEAKGGIEGAVTAGKELDQLKNKIQYFFGMTNAVNLFKRAIRSAVATVKDLDAVMTEAAVVTNFSVGDMWSQLPEYTKRANALGVSIHDAYESATLYYQQGLKTNEVVALSNETLKMARIAGLGAEEATQRMTNALRGFNMELSEGSAQRVNDVYSSLAAHAAANTDQISTAMTKVASLAHNANMELETTAAFLTQIIETTQESAETAGTALKTVIARFSEVKKLYSSGELTGQDEEGEGIDVNKVASALKTAGIDMNAYFTGMKGLDQVFLELAQKWNSLDIVQQRYIATQAAGSRQQSRFIAMMSDYARTQELVSIAENSAGASNEQFQKTLESFEAKVQQMENAWNEFTMGLANSTVIKFVIDLLTNLLNVFNDITNKGPSAIQTISKLLTAIVSFKIVRSLFKKGLANLGGQLRGDAVKAGTSIGQGVTQGLGKESSKWGTVFKGNLSGVTKELHKYNVDSTFMAAQGEKVSKAFEEGKLSVGEYGDQVIRAGGNIGKLAEKYGDLDRSFAKAEGFYAVANGMQVAGTAAMGLSTVFTLLGTIFPEASEEMETVAKIAIIVGLAFSTLAPILNMIGNGFIKAGKKALVAGTETEAAGYAAQAPWAWIIIIITAVIAVFALLISISKKAAHEASLEGRLEKVNERIKESEEAATALKSRLDDIEDSRKTFDDMVTSLHNLTKGTNAWKQQLAKVNSQVIELLNKFPELAPYLTRSEDGELGFTDTGWDQMIKSSQEGYIDQTVALTKERLDAIDLQIAQIKESAIKGDISWTTADAQILEKQIQADALRSSLSTIMLSMETELDAATAALASSLLGTSESMKEFQQNITDTAKTLGETKYSDTASGDDGTKRLKQDFAEVNDAFHYFNGELYKDAEHTEKADDISRETMLEAVAAAEVKKDEKNQEIQQKLIKATEELEKDTKDKNKADKAGTAKRLLENGGEALTQSDLALLKTYGSTLKDQIKGLFTELDLDFKDFNQSLQTVKGTVNNITEENNNLSARLKNLGVQDQASFENVFKNLSVSSEKALVKQLESIHMLGGDNAIDTYLTQLNSLLEGFTRDEQVAITNLITSKDYTNEKSYTLIADELRQYGVDNDKLNNLLTTITDNTIIDYAADFDSVIANLKNINTILEDIRVNNKREFTQKEMEALQQIYGTDAAGWERIKDQFVQVGEMYYYSGKSINLYNDAVEKRSQGTLQRLEQASKKDDMDTKTNIQSSITRLEQEISNINTQNEQLTSATEDEQKEFYRNMLLNTGVTTISSSYDITTGQYKHEFLDTSKWTLEQLRQAYQLALPKMKETEYYRDQITKKTGSEYSLPSKTGAVSRRYLGSENELVNQSRLEQSYATGSYWTNNLDLKNTDELEEQLSKANEMLEDWKELYGNLDKYVEADIQAAIATNDLRGIQADIIALNKLNDVGAFNDDPTRYLTLLENANNAIQKSARSYGIASIYADRYDESLSDLDRDHAIFYTQLERAHSGFKDVNDSLKAFGEAFDTSGQDALAYQQSLIKLRDIISTTFNTEISQKFMNKNQQLFYQLAQGSESAAQSLYNAYLNEEELKEGFVEFGQLVEWTDFDATGVVTLDINTDIAEANVERFKKWAQAAGLIITQIGDKQIQVGNLWKSFGGYSVANNKKKASNDWLNPYDQFYNLVQQINRALKEREALERRYNMLLKDRSSTQKDFVKNQAQELTNLYKQMEMNKQLLSARKAQAAAAGNELYKTSSGSYKSYAALGATKYAKWNADENRIEINWEEINKVHNKDLGGAIEGYINALEKYQDDIDDINSTLWDIEDTIEEIESRDIDNYISLEERVAAALELRDQKIVDAYQEYSDQINNTQTKVLSAMQESIDLERQIRDNTKAREDITDKEQRLAYLQRDTTGANQLEIMRLQEEIDDARQSYTDTLIDQQLQEMQKANDKAQQQREEQIALMNDMIADNREYGKYAAEANHLIESGSREEVEKLLEVADGTQYMSKIVDEEWQGDFAKQWAESQSGVVSAKLKTAQEQAKKEGGIEVEGGRRLTYKDGKWYDGRGGYYTTLRWDKGREYYTSKDDYIHEDEYKRPQIINQTPTGGSSNGGNGGNVGTELSLDDPKYAAESKALWDQVSNNPYYYAVYLSHKSQGKSIQEAVKKILPAGKSKAMSEWIDQLSPTALQTMDTKLKNIWLENYSKITDSEVTPSTTTDYQRLSILYSGTSNIFSRNQQGQAFKVWNKIGNKEVFIAPDGGIAQFATGGLADFTGPAWLDGTKSHPELVLNQRDTANFIQLRDILGSLLTSEGAGATNAVGDAYFDIDINAEIGSDYDVDQLVERLRQEIVDNSNYRNVNTLGFMR